MWLKGKVVQLQQVKGPVGGLVYHLQQLGWEQGSSPTQLVTRDGIPLDLSLTAPRHVHAVAARDARDAAFDASLQTRKDATGVEQGVDTVGLELLRRQIRPDGEVPPSGLATSEAALRGSLWSCDRLHEAGYVGSPCCPFCPCAICTLEHLIWECPRWRTLRGGAWYQGLGGQFC